MSILREIKPNTRQKECIDNINGTYMVLAGPGTGKTFTLTNRIKSMIEKHNINPDEILCLTYSDAAASEMKLRLVSVLGNIAVNLQISTYHGFSSSIIQNYPEKFNFDEKATLIDSVSKQMIAKKCLDDFAAQNIDLTLLKDKWGNYYKAEDTIIQAVSDIKANRLTKQQFLSNIETNEQWLPLLAMYEEKREIAINKNRGTKGVDTDIEKLKQKIEKAKLIWNLAEQYCKLMANLNYFDFEDMVGSVVDIAEEDSDLGEEALGRYKYILIDEYQDTNSIQNKLIDKIAHYSGTGNIFAVGDDDQIIYGFQGASLDNCENFLRKYPGAKVICLIENNRSTQNILDFGYQIISQDSGRLETNPEFLSYGITKKLIAKNDDISKFNQKIKYNIYNETIEENIGIVDQIEKIINGTSFDCKLSEIAVLGRTNSQIEELARLLEARGISYQKKTQKNIFEVQSTLLLYSYLKILNNKKYSVDKQFQLLMSEPFKLDEEDYNYILSQNRPLHRDFFSIIEENSNHGWKNSAKIKNFLTTYNKLQELKFTKSLHNFIIHAVNETGILAYYANSKINTEENILALKRFIAEAAAFKKIYIRSFMNAEIKPGPYLSDFLNYLDKCWNSGAAPELEKSTDVLNAVQLLTYHGAKGREFKYVFMPWLKAKNFEKKRNKNDFRLPFKPHSSENKDENLKSELLKLLFVGITRAKHDLYLSFSMQNEGKAEELTELLSKVLTDNPLIETKTIPGSNAILSTLQSFKTGIFDTYKKELKERIQNIELSAHSFDTYKKCPRKYLYGEVLSLPVMQDDKSILDYGNAIHFALQYPVKYAKDNGYYPDKDKTIKIFLDKLSEYEFENEEAYIKLQTRGIKALSSYYHHITDIPIKNIYAVEHRFANINFGAMNIKGFIDYIEKNDDGTFSIYDYKTGSAKAKSSVAKNKAYENYYCQLAFYKIAFELENNGAKVSKTGIKFVEEENKDININYTDEEIETIKREINDVIEKIAALKFDLPQNFNSDGEICSKCNYRLICKLNNDFS